MPPFIAAQCRGADGLLPCGFLMQPVPEHSRPASPQKCKKKLAFLFFLCYTIINDNELRSRAASLTWRVGSARSFIV
jgi:hypothetical protein